MPEPGCTAEKSMGLLVSISFLQLMRKRVWVFLGWVVWSPVHSCPVLRALQTHHPPLHPHTPGVGEGKGDVNF